MAFPTIADRILNVKFHNDSSTPTTKFRGQVNEASRPKFSGKIFYWIFQKKVKIKYNFKFCIYNYL